MARIQATVTNDIHTRVREICDKTGESESGVAARLIEKGLDSIEVSSQKSLEIELDSIKDMIDFNLTERLKFIESCLKKQLFVSSITQKHLDVLDEKLLNLSADDRKNRIESVVEYANKASERLIESAKEMSQNE